ncbi:MAG: hypothetical protein HOC70_10605 [Gammaproteobacteria bacterium]|nr:hypothetical protein [Gammaproteobacteria bacterium]MBT4493685.1 hypothetical protein [Gammaproteobacteria bacterium]MBT7371148.1 hypothetical protein [Gammaproteobacteria bacterium]
MIRVLKDPLIRRFISASFFAAAFVWVAVRYFDVETEVVWVLLTFSVLFVLGLIVVGFMLTPLVRLFRREPTLLSKIGEPADEENVSRTPEDE